MSSPADAPPTPPAAAGEVREPGAVWLKRLRLEQPLAFGAAGAWWLATDLRTGCRHSVEFLDVAPAPENAEAWAARLAEGLALTPAGVLSYFRCEAAASGWLGVAADAVALAKPAPWTVEALARGAPDRLLAAWLGVARAVALLHEQGRPAHGAIAPALFAGETEGPLLLTGFPCAALRAVEAGAPFASPQRRAGQAPMHVDDIFSLAGAAYFALTGGELPPVFGGAPAPEQEIDRVRAARQLAPTGWASGWDAAVLSALRDVPSLRPPTVRALVDALVKSTGVDLPSAASAAAPRRMRQPPAWRRGGARTPAASAAVAATPGLAADWLQKLTEERAQLAREREESERRQAQLAADLERSSGERRDLETTARKLAHDRTELAKAQHELAASQAALAELRTKLHATESGLAGREDSVATRQREIEKRDAELRRTQTELQAREQQVATRSAETEAANKKLSAERAESAERQQRLEQLQTTVTADRERLRADQENLARERDAATALRTEVERRRAACDADEQRLKHTARDIEARGTELEARDKALQEVQRTIAAMAGGADVNKWLAFASQVEARGLAQEKRTGELEELQQKLAARTSEIEAEQRRVQEALAAAQRQQEENQRRRAEIDAEKSSVARLHQEATQALEMVRRAARPARPAPVANAPAAATPGESAAAPPPPPIPAAAGEVAIAAPADVPAIPGSSAPPPPPPPPALVKATLEVEGGRRFHLFGGPVVRFGRFAQSDIVLIVLVKGQREPALALNKEISRKHFELHVGPDGARVRDGWSDEPAPSRTGICLDGRRVGAEGAALHTGAVLSVTTRPLSRAIPHWEVTVLGPNGRLSRGAAGPLSAVYLRRLDDAPDDLLVLVDAVSLGELQLKGFTPPPGAVLLRQPAGLALALDGDAAPLVAGESPLPGLRALSIGSTTPTVALGAG